MSKNHLAVIGATGQVGKPLTKSLLKEGHEVTIIAHGRSLDNEPRLAECERLGAKVVVCTEMDNIDAVAGALKGCDTLVACVPGSKSIIQKLQPIWLNAAVKAGVERFIPTEFGSHTRAIEMGDGAVFDQKKRFWYYSMDEFTNLSKDCRCTAGRIP